MATEKRLIDANALVIPKYEETGDEFIDGFHQGKCDAIIEVSALAPTVDAVEVVHGRWIWKDFWHTGVYSLCCSECLETEGARENAKYCPNCGAKMDGGNEDV